MSGCASHIRRCIHSWLLIPLQHSAGPITMAIALQRRVLNTTFAFCGLSMPVSMVMFASHSHTSPSLLTRVDGSMVSERTRAHTRVQYCEVLYRNLYCTYLTLTHITTCRWVLKKIVYVFPSVERVELRTLHNLISSLSAVAVSPPEKKKKNTILAKYS